MIRVIAVTLISAYGVPAQSVATSPSFEVSTVKPASPDSQGMTFRFAGPRRFTANNHTLKECIGFAYNLTPALMPGGPPWLESDRYDIVGELPGETQPPRDQLLLMFQGLLAERFKLKFHREQKEMTVYNLVVGKNGLKIKESTTGPPAGSLLIGFAPPRGRSLPARNATMQGFASLLQRVVVDRPVIDKTGLSGRYDFDLEWGIDGTRVAQSMPPPPLGESETQPDITVAIQKLGLKLESAKGMVDVLVIDHVERPDAN
jgi:uncharacterized protein (TIGR03435 family)